MPHPSMQAYSAPELLKPSSRTANPSSFTMVLPWTRNPARDSRVPAGRGRGVVGLALGVAPGVVLAGVVATAGCRSALGAGPLSVSPTRTTARTTDSPPNIHGKRDVLIGAPSAHGTGPRCPARATAAGSLPARAHALPRRPDHRSGWGAVLQPVQEG